jgi:hypothetical protein
LQPRNPSRWVAVTRGVFAAMQLPATSISLQVAGLWLAVYVILPFPSGNIRNAQKLISKLSERIDIAKPHSWKTIDVNFLDSAVS